MSRLVSLFWSVLFCTYSSQAFYADLASHTVRIDTDFRGEEIVVFGTMKKKADLIVVLRGPEESLIIRKKEPIHGLWLNRASMSVFEVPLFYAMACTQPIEDMISSDDRARHAIGMKNIHFTWGTEHLDLQEIYQEALLGEKINQGRYITSCASVAFVSPTLFRTTFKLPATVPTGAYTVQLFLVENQRITDARTIPLIVTKAGSSAFISEFALHNGLAYGVLSALASLVLGLFISQFFLRTRP